MVDLHRPRVWIIRHVYPCISVQPFLCLFSSTSRLFFLAYSLPILMGSIALFKWAFLVCFGSVPNASVCAPSDWPWIRSSLMDGCDGAITASKSCSNHICRARHNLAELDSRFFKVSYYLCFCLLTNYWDDQNQDLMRILY